eukprot:Gb_20898 [translate_table: standard]
MGRLRLKVLSEAWSNRKTRDEEATEFPTGRYFRSPKIEPKVGLSDKFCVSPQNNKSLDIVYPVSPSKNGAKAMRKPAVVSVGCGCRRFKQSQAKTAEKGAHKSECDKKPLKARDASQNAEGGEADLKELKAESSWHVVARVNERVVGKKVVLKKKICTKFGAKCKYNGKTKCKCKSSSSPGSSPVTRKEIRTLNDGKFSICSSEAPSFESSTSKGEKSSDSAAPCSYRLSTSSADTACFEPATCSWDKEYYSFTSDLSPRKSFSSNSSFDVCDNYNARLSTIDESPLRLKTPRKVSQNRQDKRNSETVKLPPEKLGSGNMQETMHTWSKPEAPGCSGYSQGLKDFRKLESSAKDWRESGLKEDFTALNLSADYLGVKEVQKRKNGSSQGSKAKSLNSRKCAENYVGCSARAGKIGESVVVVKSSEDPYMDFRSSMLQMIFEKQIFKASELIELLECFLSLNSREHHGLIIRVFTEICEKNFKVCNRDY